MKRKPVIHPFLFAIFPVLFLYGHNLHQITPGRIVSPLVFLIVLAVVLWTAFGLLLKNLRLAAALTSLFLLLFFSYGHFYSLVRELTIGGLRIGRHWFLMPFWAVLYGLGCLLCFRARSHPTALTKFFHITGGVLILVPFFQIGANAIQWGGRGETTTTSNPSASEPANLKTEGPLPNIYYIILDAYARGDILGEIYGFDNCEFQDHLQSRGFYIAEGSRSNYDMSLMSLASSLNYQYLDESIFRKNGLGYLRGLFEDNRVVRSLKQLGYKLAAFASGYDNTELPKANIYLTSGWSPDDFQAELINYTPIPPLLTFIGRGGHRSNLQHRLHRERIIHALENLPEIARDPGPLFVFAHILAPHPPFVFNEKGNPIQLTDYYITGDAAGFRRRMGITIKEYHDYYISQLKFINKKVVEMVDGVLENSLQPPIIILQADHGPRSQYVFCDLEASNLNEGLSILNAYYLPGGGQEQLFPTITPVNTFRVIFNRYFNTSLDLLPDKSYFTDWRDDYFTFREVF
ncbi:MAG: hypothetical protein P9M10_00015 [Candidatus Euphemobacter frigidus]|nr:hypothetical protein [Candidatus Euphemobacter frigidus]